jgi:hypothetical protein
MSALKKPKGEHAGELESLRRRVAELEAPRLAPHAMDSHQAGSRSREAVHTGSQLSRLL